jgi:hypothetical protein
LIAAGLLMSEKAIGLNIFHQNDKDWVRHTTQHNNLQKRALKGLH